jgi:erythromycin esterase-like protein
MVLRSRPKRVTQIDTDPHARYAIYAYAASISGQDDEFADNLRAWVKQYDGAVEQRVQRTELCSGVGHSVYESVINPGHCHVCGKPLRR